MRRGRRPSFSDWKKQFHHHLRSTEEAKKALKRLMQKGCNEQVLLVLLWAYTGRQSFSVTSLLNRWGYPRKGLQQTYLCIAGRHVPRRG